MRRCSSTTLVVAAFVALACSSCLADQILFASGTHGAVASQEAAAAAPQVSLHHVVGRADMAARSSMHSTDVNANGTSLTQLVTDLIVQVLDGPNGTTRWALHTRSAMHVLPHVQYRNCKNAAGIPSDDACAVCMLAA